MRWAHKEQKKETKEGRAEKSEGLSGLGNRKYADVESKIVAVRHISPP